MTDPVHGMVESRNAQMKSLQAELQALDWVKDFVSRIQNLSPEFSVAIQVPCDGAVLIDVNLGADRVGRVKSDTAQQVGAVVEITVPPVVHGNESQATELKTGEWSEDELDLFKVMCVDGKSTEYMARELNRSGQSIGAKRRWLRDLYAEIATTVEPSSEPDPKVIATPRAARDEPTEVSSPPAGSVVRESYLLPPVGKVAEDFSRSAIEGHIHHIYSMPADFNKPFWGPDADLILVTELIAGNGVSGVLAALKQREFEADRDQIITRWRDLCPHVTVQNQRHVSDVISQMVGERDHRP